ncbi:membrane protein insertase YidC [Candidatus Mycoplasma mahonii]|uniref:membrane protein insertase YidC n=1 Tax=Candidatus Mycoplasma mahonii TaxID=3004105 RepID=UPI0026ECD970|nr:membrane protein insertase YidC [Candidatus Mycoplasma mahonii]WKX02487.1 membrane protein insertase YidC [Candidatus Mycoplasma mahonii]
MKQNKSNNYDWFQVKGPGEKRDLKEKLKLFWKFFRMFLYLSLFVFTMTGCVQVLIVKVDTKIGRGVEFYANKDKVSPHITNFSLKNTKHKQTTLTVDDKTTVVHAYETYDLRIDPKDTIWIDDKTLLKTIRVDVIGRPLQDAYKGANEAAAITGDVTMANTPKGQVLNNANGLPMVLSTLGNKGLKYIDYFKNKTANINNGIKGIGNHLYIDPIELRYVDPTSIVATTDKQFFGLDIINSILAKNVTSTMTLAQWIKKILNDDFLELYETIEGKHQIKDANNIMGTLYGYAGIIAQIPMTKGATISKLTFSENFMPGVGSNLKTNYRPFVRWGDAWSVGPFYGIFVYPIATIAAKLIDGLGDMDGWETLITIFIVVWAIRAFTFALSFKSTMQQTKMQEMAGKKAIIDAKYANHKGNKQMEQRQKQEVSELYKKEGINPLGSIGSIFLTMPFFLAMWRVIGALPHIKATVWIGINFSATSYKELMTWTEWQYLPLMILAAFFAVMQQLMPRLLTRKRNNNRINVHQKAAMKKNNKTQNIMMIVFGIMGLAFSAGMQVYWIAGGMWMILQSYATHRFFIYQHRSKRKK